MIRRLLLLAACATGLVATAGSPAASAVAFPADATLIVSGAPDLLSPLPAPVNDSHSTRAAVSASGQLVAFDSRSDGLAADDDDNVRNVYVKDMTSGAVTLVSRASDAGGLPGEPAHADCRDAAISGDGTHVAFVCRGPLEPRDTNGRSDVYVRDLVHGTTTLVSCATGATGPLGDDEASQPALDADGGVVAFVTEADNIGGVVAGNRAAHVYRRDFATGTTLLVSRTQLGDANGRDAASPSLSDDGQRVAFSVEAVLTADDANGAISDVYVRDFSTGTIQLVSRASDTAVGVPGASGDKSSSEPMISGNGSTVVFESLATNLDPRHDFIDVYRRRLGAAPGLGTTELMSIQVNAARALDGGGFDPVVNHDGSVVAFGSSTTTVDAADMSIGADVYVRRSSGVIGLASRADGSGGAASDRAGVPAIDAAGTRVVTTVGGTLTADLAVDIASSVMMRDTSGAEERTRSVSRPPGEAPFVNTGGDALSGAISPDGRFVAFTTFALGLGVPRRGAVAILVRDLATGETTLASRADGPDGAVLDGFADEPCISADGRRVAFVFIDFATNQRYVYVRDLAAGRTFVANAPDGSDTPAPSSGALVPSISDDGARVEFTDNSSLVGDDADSLYDVYVRDVDAHRTLLADRADGPAGAKAAGGADFTAAISGDGRHVAFSTTASLVVQGDGDAVQDVYVRDLDAGTTTLASVAGQAAKGDANSLQPTISRDGSRVAFLSRATTFGGPVGQRTAYVRDLAARTLTIAAARADGGDGAVAGLELLGASLSGDGQHVRFVALPAASIAPGAPGDGVIRVYERDLARGTTRLASRASGADGAPADAGGTIGTGNQSADGGCVLFVADGRALTPPASSDHVHVYLRAFEPDCGRPVPPPPPPGRSRSAAVLSHLTVRPARFHVGGRRGGTRILFRLDGSANVSLRVERLLAGHRAHGRCSARAHRGRRCTVVRRVGRLPVAHGRAGANAVRFSGRMGARALAPGRYRLIATPAGGSSRTANFIVVKAHAKHRGRR
jgi:Tol biopolymer transport system component